MPPSRQERLASLRAEIRRLEGYALTEETARLRFGLPPLDGLLPEGGLPLPALHLVEPARKEWDDGLASGFLAALLSKILQAAGGGGPLLWISRHDDLYGPGLLSFGLSPKTLLLARARSDREVLWCLEEGLRDGGPSALVGELGAYDQVAARRLQLAAEAAARPCFLLLRPFTAPRKALPGGPASHWRVSPSAGPGGAGTAGLPGRAAWFIELLRCRGGRSGTCLLEWNDATGDFSLAAPLCDAEPDAVAGFAPAGFASTGFAS
jgi:protein ImuA